MSKESTGKRITDELRDKIKGTEQLYGIKCKCLTAIADRIDAAHQKAEDEWKAKDGQTWLRGYGECHAEFMEGNEVIAADLEKAGWYRALDGDKQPIKFGDEVEWRHPCGSCELRHVIVTGIKTDKIGDEVFHEVTVKVDRFTVRLMANQLRHYHKPTVEDMLLEFYVLAVRGKEAHAEDVDGDVLAEYAAKLRLAGDAE